jgi:predicted esterase
MSFQMGAFQANIPAATYLFLDAPYPARGDPDPGIGMFYPDRPYYEWFYKSDDDDQGYEGLDESMKRLEEYIAAEGPFDGLLGFSQGASMVTRLVKRQETDGSTKRFKFVVFIGGVPPAELLSSPDVCTLTSVPSLHIMGESDPFLPHSQKLEAVFGGKRTTMVHSEGHNIPSIRTNLYPQIDQWINNNT